MELVEVLQVISQHAPARPNGPEPVGRAPSHEDVGRGPSPDCVPRGQQGDRRLRRRLGRGLIVANRKRRKRQRLQQRKEHQLDEQALAFNRSGRARTKDFEFPIHKHQLERPASKGKGAWKKWTAPAILRAAFASANTAARSAHEQVEGASTSHSSHARMVAAQSILRGQEIGVKQALNTDCKLCIFNLMFDESGFQLKLGKGQPLTDCSVLCSHGQLTYEPVGGPITDEHLARPPVLLPAMNWATLWSALKDGLVAECNARFVATLVSCDAHAANVKMLRFAEHTLPREHFLLPVLCAQHRTGNVVEQLTKLLGLLGGNFSVTKAMSRHTLLRSIRGKVADRVEASLQVRSETPAATLREWQAAKSTAEKLVELCLFEMPQSGRPGSQRDDFAKLLEFFSSPWTGQLRR